MLQIFSTDLVWFDGFTCHMHVLAEGNSINTFLSQEDNVILPNLSATSCQDSPAAVSSSLHLKGLNFYGNPPPLCSFYHRDS